MNTVTIIGRITKDPEIRYSQGETATAFGNYTLAVDRPTRKGYEKVTDFIPCRCIGKSAEFAENYLFKGMKIAVRGRIQVDSYTARDGSKKSSMYVLIEEQEFCESKNTSETKPQYSQTKPAPSNAIADGFLTIPDDCSDEGLPFN